MRLALCVVVAAVLGPLLAEANNCWDGGYCGPPVGGQFNTENCLEEGPKGKPQCPLARDRTNFNNARDGVGIVCCYNKLQGHPYGECVTMQKHTVGSTLEEKHANTCRQAGREPLTVAQAERAKRDHVKGAAENAVVWQKHQDASARLQAQKEQQSRKRKQEQAQLAADVAAAEKARTDAAAAAAARKAEAEKLADTQQRIKNIRESDTRSTQATQKHEGFLAHVRETEEAIVSEFTAQAQALLHRLSAQLLEKASLPTTEVTSKAITDCLRLAIENSIGHFKGEVALQAKAVVESGADADAVGRRLRSQNFRSPSVGEDVKQRCMQQAIERHLSQPGDYLRIVSDHKYFTAFAFFCDKFVGQVATDVQRGAKGDYYYKKREEFLAARECTMSGSTFAGMCTLGSGFRVTAGDNRNFLGTDAVQGFREACGWICTQMETKMQQQCAAKVTNAPPQWRELVPDKVKTLVASCRTPDQAAAYIRDGAEKKTTTTVIHDRK